MSPHQAEIIRRSHFRLLSRPAQLAAMFRVNLLCADPSLSQLVAVEGDQHEYQLVQWLGAVVALLKTPELLHSSMRRLARRLGREVNAGQVCNVGRALLQTLRQALGRDWDAETEGAWTALYTRVSMAILSGLVELAREGEEEEELMFA